MIEMVKYRVNGMDGIMSWLKFVAFCRDAGVQWHPSGSLYQGGGVVGSWRRAR